MKAELEIELLHDKMNLLREEEIIKIMQMLQQQQQQIQVLEELLRQKLQAIDSISQPNDRNILS